jgi:Importin beta binding domain
MSDPSKFIPEHRRQAHKGKLHFKGDELRRRREDQQVEIRKQKKEENLAKRRNLTLNIQQWDRTAGDVSESDDENTALNRRVCVTRASVWLTPAVDYGGVPADGAGSVF